MKNDHVAALPLVHWPRPVAPWYLDLRRAASYSPVLGRWTTLNDFFHLTDRPYEAFRPEPDQYRTPYLAQAVSRRAPDPIARLARHHRLKARAVAAGTTVALARAIALQRLVSPTLPPNCLRAAHLEEIDNLIETGRHAEASAALGHVLPEWSAELAQRIIKVGDAATTDRPANARPGYLILNPIHVPRRAAVVLPDAALDLRPEGPLRVAQFTDEGVWGIVDLPALGFAWVPKEADLARPPAATAALSAKGRQLKNESIEIEIDAATGGIRSLAAPGESTARVGQQLVIAGLTDGEGKPTTSQMRSDQFEIEYGGPALVQATSSGRLIDPQNGNRLASFVQRYRLWAGRPILEIEISLSDIDPQWMDRAIQSDPYSVYLACRWAWPDPNSMLRRTVFWSNEITEAERPETPDAFDISTRTQRTALLFGGLPYHRKVGSRMLDTLLVAGSESTRSFTLGVVLDLEHPFHAAQDLIAPPLVVPLDDGPPSQGANGWLARLDRKGVAVSHVGFASATSEGRGMGTRFSPAGNQRPSGALPIAIVPKSGRCASGRFPGRHDRGIVDRRRHGTRRPDPARAGANRGDSWMKRSELHEKCGLGRRPEAARSVHHAAEWARRRRSPNVSGYGQSADEANDRRRRFGCRRRWVDDTYAVQCEVAGCVVDSKFDRRASRCCCFCEGVLGVRLPIVCNRLVENRGSVPKCLDFVRRRLIVGQIESERVRRILHRRKCR